MATTRKRWCRLVACGRLAIGLSRSEGRATSRHNRGSALLAVLWLSAALAAIGFSIAATVRGETERTSTTLDGLRSYYLAVAGVERGSMELLWSIMNPQLKLLPPNVTTYVYHFQTGDARIEILPEAGKLNVNQATVEQLFRLCTALGVDPVQAQEIAAAIDDWRRPAYEGSQFDLFYSSLNPSFRAPHASIREIEELLQVKGITPDIFYGTYQPAAEGAKGPALVWHAGLADCLTVYGQGNSSSGGAVDINTAQPAVLAAVGVPPQGIDAIMQRRQLGPIANQDLGAVLASLGGAPVQLRVGGNSIVTIRATGQLRLDGGKLSDLKRTVAAQVKYMPSGYDAPVHILRWYDTAWSN
jgi:general secretion pathway protein K